MQNAKFKDLTPIFKQEECIMIVTVYLLKQRSEDR